MEWASKVINGVSKAASNNTVINLFLVGSFVGLSVRSVKQQREIETLEAQKDSLVKSNKNLKQTIWDWKQKLYAEASSADNPVVPLFRLKSIYGEATSIPPVGNAEEKDGKAPISRIMI